MKKKASKRGPQPFKLSWDEFNKLADYQCTQKEIADFFGVSVDTLERACERDHGIKLADYWEQKKGRGRVKLKKLQFQIAEQGSTGMAIFLGKQLLSQVDKPIDQEILEVLQKLGLTKDEAIKILLDQVSVQHRSQGKKTFQEFCATADYPVPFAKQIEMKDFGLLGEGVRMILGARGYGKTDYVVILGIAYMIYLSPLTETNLIMTKSKERNASMLAEIANALKKNGVVLEKENSNFLRVAGLMGKDHSVSAVTLKTVSLRGRHPKRVILDDPVTEDDTSDATRLLVKKKYNEINKLCGNILIIGQPAHKFDLYADVRGTVKTLEVPHGSIVELDHDLDAQRKAGVDEDSIQKSYFLKVPDEGATPFDNVKYIDQFPVGDSAVAFIDPSHEGGDYTALTIIRFVGDAAFVFGKCFKKSWNHSLDDMAPYIARLNVQKLCFETNGLGSQPLDILRQIFPNVGVVGKRSNSNKHSRIMSAGAFAHMIHLSKESDKQYLDQVVKYEYKAKFDDAPDSLASCLEWIGLIRGVT